MMDELTENQRLQDFQNQAMSNFVIVKRICSFTDSLSVADLLRFRLINHTFQEEAVKNLAPLHKPIKLTDPDELKRFMECMRGRAGLQLGPFPFSSFDLHACVIWDGFETDLDAFAREVGPHVKHYAFTHIGGVRGQGQFRDTIFAMQDVQRQLAKLLHYSSNLTEIHMESGRPVCMFKPESLALVPACFPKLQVIDVTYECSDFPLFYGNENQNPLLPLLISRAPRLKSFIVPTPAEVPDISTLRVLIENHNRRLPALSFGPKGVLEIRPSNFATLRELEEMNLSFSEVKLELSPDEDTFNDDQDIEDAVDTVSSWLATQDSSLITLSIQLWNTQLDYSFQFPILPALKDLMVGFPFEHEHEPEVRPATPLTLGQFPALEKLRLDRYEEDYEFFGPAPLVTVKNLKLKGHRSILSAPWNVTFPNLTSLSLDFDCDVSNFRAPGPCLSFVLTHFPRLFHLDIELSMHSFMSTGSLEFWDILTGGAPRPENRFCLLFGNLNRPSGALPEPMDGIYQTPSLANMRELKTFRMDLKHPSHLEAILFLTRTGLLIPLQKLSLKHRTFNHMELTETEAARFHEVLSEFHVEVQWNDTPGYPVESESESESPTDFNRVY